MTPEPARTILAVITGERGQREIVRPLAAVGQTCVVLDWEILRARGRVPHLRFVRDLWRMLRMHRSALVFTDMNSVFFCAVLLLAKRHGSKVLLRLRGDPFAETAGQLRFHWDQRQYPEFLRVGVAWLLDRPLFTRVDRFIPVSHWIVRRLGIAGRAGVVRIPVSLPHVPAPAPWRPAGLRLLAVTNFNFPQKVAALGRFLSNYHEFLQTHGLKVSVAGAGLTWERFRVVHAEHANFLGFVPQVSELYRDADVFIHFSDLDAFPYVVLEAQAAALPVMVNADCGMLEQVEHERTGLVVDLAQRSTVEGYLRQLSDSAELRINLGTAARQQVAERYSMKAIGEDLLKEIASAVS